MMQRLFDLLLIIGSLAAIGYGCYQIYPPSAWIVIGLLIWVDISRGGSADEPDPNPVQN